MPCCGGLDNRIHMAGTGTDMVLRYVDRSPGTAIAFARTVGRDAGRRRPHLSEPQRMVLHVDLVATPYFARNPALLRLAAVTRHSRILPAPSTTSGRPIRPREPTARINKASCGRMARSRPTLPHARQPCIGVIGCRATCRATSSSPSPRRTSSAASSSPTTARPSSAEGVSTGGVPELHGRAVPAGLPVERARRHALRGGYLQGNHSAPRLHHRVLRDQIASRALEQPIGLGRIYRVVHDGTVRDRTTLPAKAPSSQLVGLLSHPSGWWRDTAQRLLVERGDQSVAPALTALVETAPDWRTRVHALWTLDGLNSVTAATVVKALADSSRDVRVGGESLQTLARGKGPSASVAGCRSWRGSGLGGPAAGGGLDGCAAARSA